MGAGRPKKPTELKKIQGTYRKDRDKENIDVVIADTSIIISDSDKVPVPKTLTTKKGKRYFKDVVQTLRVLRVLSKVDIPQIEELCLTLEKFEEVKNQFKNADVFDEDFDLIEKRFERVGRRFDELAKKFYISPQARTQLKLNDLNLIKTAQEVQKNESAITNILGGRE